MRFHALVITELHASERSHELGMSMCQLADASSITIHS
jgi:hypothetical protein